jgi:polysaccharide export outer membrane protein
VRKLNSCRLTILICTCSIAISGFAQQSFQTDNRKTQGAASQYGNEDKRGDARQAAQKADIPAPADPSYVIGPSDVLSIRVWHEPDLSALGLPVRPDGKISMALLNDVQAAGLTPMQLGDEITSGLKKYVSDPQVTVAVDAINSKRIYVVGQVARPGAYPLLPQMTVLQALSSAGGFQQYADYKRMYVLRGAQKLPFSYKQTLKGQHLDKTIILQPGDTIVVP